MAEERDRVTHREDGRECVERKTWEGNPRDGHWRWDFWYLEGGDPYGMWRFCEREHEE